MKNLPVLFLLAVLLAACNSPQTQPESETSQPAPSVGTTEKVTFQSATMYAAATDFYFQNEKGEEISVRVSNLPEEQTVKFPGNLLESVEGIEGPPGANPDMVGKTFFIVKNENGEVTEIRPAD